MLRGLDDICVSTSVFQLLYHRPGLLLLIFLYNGLYAILRNHETNKVRLVGTSG